MQPYNSLYNNISSLNWPI